MGDTVAERYRCGYSDQERLNLFIQEFALSTTHLLAL
jgi:hypothetical protein